MKEHKVILQNIAKLYERRIVFKNINKEFISGNIYGIAGNNGTGKSTLAKIISGLISPSNGKVIHTFNKSNIDEDGLHNRLGFVAPYLVLYDEFTAEENLIFAMQIRGLKYNKENADSLFNEFGLFNRRKDVLRKYSSGMKQRLKFILSLIHNPTLLVLDEPTSNLDNKGKETVYNIVKEEAKEKLIIIASNEKNDLILCDDILQLEDYKKTTRKRSERLFCF